MARECSIAMARERGLPMARECSLTKVKGRHCEERSDAAVHAGMKSWIATAYGLAMTKVRPRDDEGAASRWRESVASRWRMRMT